MAGPQPKAANRHLQRKPPEVTDSLQQVHQLVHRAKNDWNVRLRFLLLGLPYEDLTKERLKFLVHELNARFELLKHGFADVQLFTVVDASRTEQQCFPLFLSN